MTYTIYGKSNCAGCDQAKKLLESNGVQYTYVDITHDALAMQMFRNSGFRAVPQIFKGDDHIGGVAELQAQL